MESSRTLKQLLLLSVTAAIVTITLKTAAWLLTGSVGLLSDAAESLINLVAALIALGAVQWTYRDPANPARQYVASLDDGRAVGTSMGLLGDAGVNLVCGAVLEEARGLWVYRALVGRSRRPQQVRRPPPAAPERQPQDRDQPTEPNEPAGG